MSKKLQSPKGFTLIEMLACVIILVLMSVVCSTGLNLAMNSYNRSVYESNSQMLESTLDMYLGDILRHATSIATENTAVDAEKPEEKAVLYFTSSDYQIYEGTIEVSLRENDEGGIFLIYRDKDTSPTPMVSENMYVDNLYVESFTLIYNEATHSFTGSYVIKSTILDDVARECEFVYRAILEN